MEKTLILDFDGLSSSGLHRTHYYCDLAKKWYRAVRGKSSGAYYEAGSFQMSRAVRALCILVLRSTPVMQKLSNEAALVGKIGSMASSLAYAVAKQPQWLVDMFGADSLGYSNIRRLILMSNSSLRSGSLVALSINPRMIKQSNICIRVNGTEASEPQIRILESVLSQVEVNYSDACGTLLSVNSDTVPS